MLQGSHKHLVTTKGIGAVLVDHVIRVPDVAARFGHFLIILTQNDSLVDQSLERLRLRYITEIEQDLLPEPRVKQMKNRVLGPANVQIDATRLLAPHPVPVGRFAYETAIVVGITKSQVIPT